MRPGQLKTSVLDATRDTLVDRLSGYDRVVEVGIGHNPTVAAGLAQAGVAVTATDIYLCEVPSSVTFAVDDLTSPERALYVDADAIYALNLPPELHRPAADLARDVAADLLFTTLGADPPVVPVTREQLPGETLFVATR